MGRGGTGLSSSRILGRVMLPNQEQDQQQQEEEEEEEEDQQKQEEEQSWDVSERRPLQQHWRQRI
jgi:hypothetical protein